MNVGNISVTVTWGGKQVNQTVLQVMIYGTMPIRQRWKILNLKTVIYSTRVH